ncbi:MAG: tRNA (N(6)-L-threonylcarbamoyladenosine(37)-C(2))-methylthiotransferase MtaB [Bacteroidaceae bacterium]|nr:tRNA (N(6)-L-threonylcarbamoyladenosine(37)-C(2))-methylthiotransferase MtaB [Bacteroidaceae bacterium]
MGNAEFTLEGKSASFYTLGCKLNFSETSTIMRQLIEAGAHKAVKGEKADICVINTCSVTEVADKKCRQAIHKIVRENPDAYIVVTGCYGQLQPGTVADIPGVDVVLGQDLKGSVLENLNGLQKREHGISKTVGTNDIKNFVPSCSRGDRTRFFLKVQDGCDYYCTYCTVAYARGHSRNPSIESLVEQARQAGLEGGREIVITGVNIGDFGKSTGDKFIDLIRELDKVEEISRYRISSIEPNLLTDEVIDFVAGSRAFMPHFHIPLQSGSNEVLKLMHRRYEREVFAEKVARVKSVMPDAFIGVDVIVGMRGETNELFEDAYCFIEGLDVTQLHVFSYSERPGTAALKIPYKVSPQIKHERSQRLLELSDRKTRAFYEAHIGREANVLVERPRRGMPAHGFTDNYIRVELDSAQVQENSLVRVLLGGFNAADDALMGTIIK